MDMKNIFAIGDIHGCLDKLDALMEKIETEIDPDRDLLVFLGDYIDRGPESYSVVEYLIDLGDRFGNTVFLKGNHEEMLEKYLAGPDRYTYLVNGGQQTLDSYLRHARPGEHPIPETHRKFYQSLALYHESDAYIFVHAGLRDNVPIQLQDPDDLLWIREGFVESRFDFGKKIVFGHTPFPEPLVQPNKIGVDTGAVYGNQLTCVKLPALEFHSV